MKKIMLFNIFVVLLLALASVNVRAVSLAGLVDQNGSFIDSGLIFSGWTVNQSIRLAACFDRCRLA